MTLCVLLSPWPIWLVWEIYLLIRRAQPGPKVKTISMVARDVRHHTSSVIYLTSGMAMHWWAPWRQAGVAESIAFWAIALGLLVWDLALRNRPVATWPTWLIVARDPPLWLLVGGLAGFLLFPQGV